MKHACRSRSVVNWDCDHIGVWLLIVLDTTLVAIDSTLIAAFLNT
ncbi:MAG: hypothetical protein R3E01_05120 [Pirellulaceae bacterium]